MRILFTYFSGKQRLPLLQIKCALNLWMFLLTSSRSREDWTSVTSRKSILRRHLLARAIWGPRSHGNNFHFSASEIRKCSDCRAKMRASLIPGALELRGGRFFAWEPLTFGRAQIVLLTGTFRQASLLLLRSIFFHMSFHFCNNFW